MLLFASVALALILATLSYVDFNHYRLPDVGTLPLIVAGCGLNLYLADVAGLGSSIIGSMVGFLSLWLVATVYRRYRRLGGLGLGDAKLLAAAGAWLGPLYLAPTVLIGAILALGFVLLLRMTGRQISIETRVPFGPFLSASFFLLWCMHVAALL